MTQPDQLDQFKKLIEIVASCLTLIAIIAGAFWTYWLFVRTRQKYPSASLTQRINYRLIAEGKLWLRVTVTLQNTGKVLLSLVHATAWIQKVAPVDEDMLAEMIKGNEPVDEEGMEYSWLLAADEKEKDWARGERQIEPGESDQVNFDFILSPELETILVYTYFRNAQIRRAKELGWRITNVYDLEFSKHGGKSNENGTSTTQSDTAKNTTHEGHATGTAETKTTHQEEVEGL